MLFALCLRYASQTFHPLNQDGVLSVDTFIAERRHFDDCPEPGGARRLDPAGPGSVGLGPVTQYEGKKTKKKRGESCLAFVYVLDLLVR